MSNKETSKRQSGISDVQVRKKPHYIVCIGASAGGLEAIHEVFDHFPEKTNFSFVIIQHLSPDYKSLIGDLLTKHTNMEISEATDGILVKPNQVYHIPSNRNILFRNGKLHLIEKPKAAPNNAIDVFLESLASDQRERAIAVILSGTGTDGTKGIQRIHENGGIVIVQKPSTAKFDGMPNSAIQTDVVDMVLAPKKIGSELWKYVLEDKHRKKREGTQERDIRLENEELVITRILDLINENTNYDFTAYKRHTISRRIIKRRAHLGIDSIEAYYDFLENNEHELDIISKEFLIGVTKFFRDDAAFKVLRQQVLEPLVERKIKEDAVLKLWVAACSTGEEAYSLAIIISEILKEKDQELDVKIFATDVDRDSIDFASRGAYSESIKEEINTDLLREYFHKEGKKYSVSAAIRRMVIFAHHNLIKDPPFSKIDLVSCRNMLIYMNSDLQKKILRTFHFATNVGGYLFLGMSENATEIKGSLKSISEKLNIFQVEKASKTYIFSSSSPKTERQLEHNDNGYGDRNDARNPKKTRSRLGNKVNEIFNESVIETFGYAAIFVDEELDILHAIGDYKKLLHLPDKKLEFNLLKMVPDDLSVALGAAVRKAVKNNTKVHSNRIQVNSEKQVKSISIVVKPYLDNTSNISDNFIFILFREEDNAHLSPEDISQLESRINRDRMMDLEVELKETKDHLQATVEQLETSNEELQSSNEELLSSNEELQSTNEELQSLNEELHTVNSEHQHKIKELVELNDDLNNYFRSSEIGQIFVDSKLIIRKYTPAVVKQINIIDSDIGRPIQHFSYNIKYDNLVNDIEKVIDSSQSLEREIELKDGQSYLMRILPYVRQDKKTDGAVVTFVDITKIKNLNNILSGVLNSSLNGIMALKTIKDNNGKIIDFEWILANKASEKMFKQEAKGLSGQRWRDVMPENDEEGLFSSFVRVVDTGEVLHLQHYYKLENQKSWYETSAVKIDNGIALTIADINDQKEAEDKSATAFENLKRAEEKLKRLNNDLEHRVEKRTEELSESEERFRLVSLATNDAIWDWDMVSNKIWWNDTFYKIFNISSDTLEPGIESLYNRIHESDHDRVVEAINTVLDNGKKQWNDEYKFKNGDGTFSYVFNRGYVLHNEYNTPYRMIGSMIDMTSLKHTQDELESTNENLRRINNDLDNFIYTASHDLKSPIANLEGLITLLMKKVQSKMNEEDERLFKMINNSILKFNSTIKSLTDITKVQKDLDTNIEQLRFEDILDDVIADIEHMIKQSDADIKTDFEVAEVQYTKINLRSIFYNLISNSIKYRNPENPLKISISSRSIKGFVQLKFSDNGLGMSAAQKEKLFTMFKRFHTHVEGTGIGLYMVKKMVENRDGRIEVESKKGAGTTFSIYIKKEEQL